MKTEKPTLFQTALLLILVMLCILYYQQSEIGRYVFSGDENHLILDTKNGTVYYIDDETFDKEEIKILAKIKQ